MNVAILLLNSGRGSGVVAKEHAAHLLRGNHKVYFMHPRMKERVDGAINIDIRLDGDILPVHEYLPAAKAGQKAVSAMDYKQAMSFVPAYEDALEEIIDDLDIVIGHHANLSAIATANVCRKHGKPYVLFLHGTGIEPRHLGQYDDDVWAEIQRSIEGAEGIIVTTEYVRDELVRSMVDLPMEKFHIQPCGVNTSEFHPDKTGDIFKKYNLPASYVICPGALTTMKGPQNVVEASRQYADLAPTIFIGDGEIREELEGRIGDRGRFLGFVSTEDKAMLINGSTLLAAAPEKKEHFGIIYIEAMAARSPVVAYEGGGVNSIVTKETGVLTRRDPESLGKAVRALLLDESTRNSMAGFSRLRAEKHYATTVVGSGLIHWLQQIVNNHNS